MDRMIDGAMAKEQKRRESEEWHMEAELRQMREQVSRLRFGFIVLACWAGFTAIIAGVAGTNCTQNWGHMAATVDAVDQRAIFTERALIEDVQALARQMEELRAEVEEGEHSEADGDTSLQSAYVTGGASGGVISVMTGGGVLHLLSNHSVGGELGGVHHAE